MKAYQRTLEGGIKVATGNAIRDQLAAIMEAEPETIDDEDLLAARWAWEQGGVGDWFYHMLRDGRPPSAEILIAGIRLVYQKCRRANIRERRRELKKLYPYSDEEEARRQKRGRGGPPR